MRVLWMLEELEAAGTIDQGQAPRGVRRAGINSCPPSLVADSQNGLTLLHGRLNDSKRI
jgi:hypothetical protein